MKVRQFVQGMVKTYATHGQLYTTFTSRQRFILCAHMQQLLKMGEGYDFMPNNVRFPIDGDVVVMIP